MSSDGAFIGGVPSVITIKLETSTIDIANFISFECAPFDLPTAITDPRQVPLWRIEFKVNAFIYASAIQPMPWKYVMPIIGEGVILHNFVWKPDAPFPRWLEYVSVDSDGKTSNLRFSEIQTATLDWIETDKMARIRLTAMERITS
jgi:hypothetical protein